MLPGVEHERQSSADGLGRSVRLFRLFLGEQRDPEAFYTSIADDAVAMVEQHVRLNGLVVADFGGGPGFYSEAFRRAGASALVVDLDPGEVRAHGRTGFDTVVARAEKSPLRDGSVDLAFSSNLLEHVPDLGPVADQMVRVVRPGGYVVLSYTIWHGPWGGHETSPWHLLGGHRGRRHYERRHGKAPKNKYGETMFAASAAGGMRWLRERGDLDVLQLRPRYLPLWLRWLVRVPVLREVVTWNLWMVLRVPS
ncbi:MAG: class I SAM-dependent methyltransferase [Nocardioides sp.]